MRFFEVVLSGAALISAALAVEFNSWPSSVKPGQSYEITYSPKDNTPTTIILRKGNSGNLETIGPITTTATGGSFTWKVPSDLANGGDYAFEITQAGATPNYSGAFSLTGSSAQPSSSGASSSASSASSTSASSSASSSAGSSSTSASASTTMMTSASASITPSHGSNSTVSTRTPTAASTTKSSSPSSTGGSPPTENTGAASALGSSPVAIFMGAIAAFAYLA